MGININYDEYGNTISIEINDKEYLFMDEDIVYVPISAFKGQSIKDFPFNIPIDICETFDGNTIVLHNVPIKILQQSEGIFNVQFDETNYRKYWYASVGLEKWIEKKRNVLTKLYDGSIDYHDDGAYIQFYYSVDINASSFDELFLCIDKLYNEINIATDIALNSPSKQLEYKYTKSLMSLGRLIEGKNENSIEYDMYKKQLSKMIESHLKENNPEELLIEYKTYFSSKIFHKRIIKKGERFYRGRIGNITIQGAIDDCNHEFILPHYEKGIEVPPALFVGGGRFNRAGTAYLYLATDLETCLAEIHLQVGQFCSIAEFECLEDIELINLSDFGDDLELKIWYEEITQPVHEEIRYKYLITQFMSEVFMQFNNVGLYFQSVQSNGDNIVCFQPNKFKLLQYSEKLYKAEKITYKYSQVKDTIREFSERDDTHLINSCNTEFEEDNERKIEYMINWVEKEKNM